MNPPDEYRVLKTDRFVGPHVVQWAVAVMVFLLSVAADAQSGKPQIVASVDTHEITLEEFTARYEDYLIYTGLQDNMQARFAILNNMINEVLLRTYDDNSGIYNNPEYKKDITSAWNRTVLAFLKDREVYATITATDQELREAYRRSKIKLAVRHLYARTEKEAENLYNLLKIGVSFHELAKQVFSDTTLRNNGGYLGYIGWGDTDPNFEAAAYSLKKGEISRPVKTAQGFSIIRVEDRIEDPLVTENGYLNEKRKLERAVKIEKKKPFEEAYLKRVFDENKVKFNEKALKAVFDRVTNDERMNLESKSQSAKISATCVEYKGRRYSQKEIESKILATPEFDRNLLRSVNDVKHAVLGLVMQDVLLGIAKAKGYDTTSYVRDTYEKIANDIYLNYKRNEVLALVPVADSEVTAYYHRNLATYTSEREMNVQEIVVDNDSSAFAIKGQLDHGADFGLLAERYSIRKWTAKNRGIMGLSPLSNFGNLKDTLWNLAPGNVLGPLKFDRYFGIFRVLGREDGRVIDLNLVRDQIVKAIKNEKGFPYMKQRLASLAQKATITVNNEMVKNFSTNVAGK